MDKRTLTLDKDINVMQMGMWIMQSSEWVAFLYETLDKGEKSIQQHNIWVQWNQMKFDRNKCKARHLGWKKDRSMA